MKTISIKVENLKCNGCASTIKKALMKFDEVSNVIVDIDNSVIKPEFEGNDNIVEKIKNKLASLGYPESGNNNTISVAKSYVSCAIGRINK